MKDMKARHLLGDARNEAAGVYMHTNTHLPSHQSLLLQVSARPHVPPHCLGPKNRLWLPSCASFFLTPPRIHLC